MENQPNKDILNQLSYYRESQSSLWKNKKKRKFADNIKDHNIMIEKGTILKKKVIAEKKSSQTNLTKFVSNNLQQVAVPIPSTLGLIISQQIANRFFNSTLEKENKQNLDFLITDTISNKHKLNQFERESTSFKSKVENLEHRVTVLETQYNLQKIFESDQFQEYVHKFVLEKKLKTKPILLTQIGEKPLFFNLDKSYLTVRTDWVFVFLLFFLGSFIYNTIRGIFYGNNKLK